MVIKMFENLYFEVILKISIVMWRFYLQTGSLYLHTVK